MGRNTVPIKQIKKPTLSEGWITVDSSCLSEVGYDDHTETLWLIFKKTNHAYQYPQVPKHVYDGLLAAPSQGVFFTKEIKPFYPAVEVWAEDA